MIHLNQVGFAVDLPKRAIITTKGEKCLVVSSDNESRFEPILSEPFFDSASGDTVRIVDFSFIKKCGQYFLFADGNKKTFYISERPYRKLTGALIKAMYFQRCGCALEEKHSGVYKHDICHTGLAKLIDDESIVLDVGGGWHDAGDYGRYVSPGAVSVGHMLYAFEMFPKSFQDNLNIPETGNGVPDILNECRYEIEWMMKMQREDGGLYHKVATRYFAPFIMPQDDKEELFLFCVSHTATLTYAASLAQGYRVFLPYDKAFAEKMLSKALLAWEWFENNPEFVPFVNPENVSSGSYSDDNIDDEIFWAACELYNVTGEKRFWEYMCSVLEKIDVSKLGWRDVGGLGALCCLFSSKNFDAGFCEKIKKHLIETANTGLALCEKSGYKTALDIDGYRWGSILPIMNNAMVMICAFILTDDIKYRDAALAQLDYMLGMNATGYSFVTGFGENAFRFPHNRPSYADGIDDPIPGLVSGGPNSNNIDQACKDLIPQDTPPAKFYIDHTWTASANENAIYWNTIALMVCAYFDT